MRYDDRLRTVLAQPADHPHDRAVRWRQLVELLARGGAGSSPLFDQAVTVVERDSLLVDEQVRMAAARAIAALAAPVALVRAFAADRLSVAAPVLAAARLTAADWAEVAAAASPECRGFIASLRAVTQPDDTPPEPSPAPPPPAPAPPPTTADERPVPSISEVVARIERLRQARQNGQDLEPVEMPPAEPPRLFRWECDEAGDIAWVEGVPRGAVIGRSIARTTEPDELDRNLERAFARRMPFSDARLELAEGGLAGGAWKLSGMPAFDPASGRFCGYRGVAERDLVPGAAGLPLSDRDPDSLRELVHEIKTPLNAILGFAEIITGQYLGPAEEPYRERAEAIIAQAQLLLSAIDDLDFAAHQRAESAAGSTDLRALARRIAPDLAGSGARFELTTPASTALAPALAERLVTRFCKAAAGLSDRPQHFALERSDGHCVMSAINPGIDPAAEPDLALRLVSGLARLAGGEVEIGRERLRLLLPAA